MKRIARFLSLALLAFLVALPVHATVSSETTRVKYTCNGTTTVYAYPFKIYETDDILAVKALTSTGAETTLILNTDYTVSGAGGAGGNVTLTAGSVCGSGYTLTILRNIELTQETDYVDGQAFSAESLESAIDKVTLIQQQQEEKIGRAPKLPKTSSITDIALPNPSANNYIGWNAGATNLENKAGPVATTATQYEVDALISYGGSVNYTQATIASALTAIGTTNKVTLLLRPGTWVISTDADYSAYTNVTWKVVPGALLQIASGKTLTIGGPFEAGLYQVFSGDGSVSFGSGPVKEVYSEWFQENTIPGTTDMASGFAAAYASISKGTLKLLPGLYSTSGTLTAKLGTRIEGYGAGNSDGSAGTTKVTYTGTTHWIDVPLNTPVAAVDIVGMRIHVATGLGAIWVNRTSLAYTDGQHSLRWLLKDLVIAHDIPGTVGSVGLSLTQLAMSRLEDIVVSGFETQIIDRNGTVNVFDHVRVQASSTGSMGIHFQGTSGTLQEYIYALDVGVSGLNSTGIKLDAANVQFYGVFLESGAVNLPYAMLHVTANGGSSLIHGMVWSNQIASCPLIIVDAGCTYGPSITDSVVLGALYTQITVGAASTLTLNNPNINLYNASRTARQQGRAVLNGYIQTFASYQMNAAQTVVNATPTVVLLDADLTLDDATNWELGTGGDAGKVKVKIPGKYQISGTITWTGNATGDRTLELYVGSTVIARAAGPTAAAGTQMSQTVSMLWRVTADQFVSLVATQTSTAPLDILATSNPLSRLTLTKVAN